MNDLKLVVFDWDGTLVDSCGRIVDCLRESARDAGLNVLADDAYADIIGLGLYEAIERLYPGLDKDGVAAFRDGYAKHFVARDSEPSPFFAGALEMLDHLRAEGFRIAVATGKSRRGLDRVLRQVGMRDYFDATRCADETASKPDPNMLHSLYSVLGCAPQQALMVGDTEYDLEMAARAGSWSIGVTHGVHAPARLERHAPRCLIDSLGELPAVIAQSSKSTPN